MPNIKISTILWQSISALLIPSIVCIPVYAQPDESKICLLIEDIVQVVKLSLPNNKELQVRFLERELGEAIMQIGPFSPNQARIAQEIVDSQGWRTTKGSCNGNDLPPLIRGSSTIPYFNAGNAGQPSMPAVGQQRRPLVVTPTQPVMIPQTQPVIVTQTRPLVIPQRPVVVQPFTPTAPVARLPTRPPATVQPSISSQRQVHYVVIRVRQQDLLNIFEKLILLKVPERGIFQIQSQPTPILSVGPFATSEIAERWKRYLQDFLF